MKKNEQVSTDNVSRQRELQLASVPEGMEPWVLGQLVREIAVDADNQPGVIVHVARDDRRLAQLEAGLGFFAPDVRVLSFPAWDTVPYDRIGPNSEIVARRIATLAKLSVGRRKIPTVVLTTVNAILQRVPPGDFLRASLKQIAPGQRIDMNRLLARLQLAGFRRTGTVMEPGEYAVRGGILDLFPPGRSMPVRLDFFGDTLESIKSFDPQTQRTTKSVPKVVLMPIVEVALGEEATSRFRRRYVELFGGGHGVDPLYEAVSAGSRYPGQEHWLPLFHEHMATLVDYVPDAALTFDNNADEAVRQRFEQITEHYEARVDSLEADNFGAPPYRPVPPDNMFLDGASWAELLHRRQVYRLNPFDVEESDTVQSWSGQPGRSFASERQSGDVNLFDAVVGYIRTKIAQRRRVMVAAWTPGARERLIGLLADHGLTDSKHVANFEEARSLHGKAVAMAVLGLERGFETPDLVVIGEQDILGERLIRPRRKAKRAADVLSEATSLSVGDMVVHADHGIGRFAGLKTIEALGSKHDCLELHYAGGDKLFLPVENIELLSRYGGDEGSAQIDRLGGASWQSRKSRLKQRLLEIASELIKIAALRQLREGAGYDRTAGRLRRIRCWFPI